MDAFLSTVDITGAGITGHNQYGVAPMTCRACSRTTLALRATRPLMLRSEGRGVLADTAYIGTISIDDDGGTFRGKSLLNANIEWRCHRMERSKRQRLHCVEQGGHDKHQAPRRNYIRNPSFDVAGGTSFTAATYNADLWKSVSTAARTFSRVRLVFRGSLLHEGGTGCRQCYCDRHHPACNLAPELAYQLAGKTITISADVRCGANFSATSNNLQLPSAMEPELAKRSVRPRPRVVLPNW